MATLHRGAESPRAWIDAEHDSWDREARSDGPDDDLCDFDLDGDPMRYAPDDTVEMDCAPRWLTLAEHEAEAATAMRSVFPTADFCPSVGRVRVSADEATARESVPELAGCRRVQAGQGFCWFDLIPEGA